MWHAKFCVYTKTISYYLPTVYLLIICIMILVKLYAPCYLHESVSQNLSVIICYTSLYKVKKEQEQESDRMVLRSPNKGCGKSKVVG